MTIIYLFQGKKSNNKQKNRLPGKRFSPEVYGISMDVSDQKNIEQGSNGIIERFGREDILVNNAGSWPKGSSLETSFEQWQKVINLNLHKAGVMMLTETMAMELSRDNITVNSISPGMIADEKKPNNGTWLGRSGTGDEVANAILFLASDDSSYITGADIPVDGGRTLGPHTEK